MDLAPDKYERLALLYFQFEHSRSAVYPNAIVASEQRRIMRGHNDYSWSESVEDKGIKQHYIIILLSGVSLLTTPFINSFNKITNVLSNEALMLYRPTIMI